MGVGVLQKPGGFQRVRWSDKGHLACLNPAVIILDEGAVAAAPVVLADLDLGGVVLHGGHFVRFHGQPAPVQVHLALFEAQVHL